MGPRQGKFMMHDASQEARTGERHWNGTAESGNRKEDDDGFGKN